MYYNATFGNIDEAGKQAANSPRREVKKLLGNLPPKRDIPLPTIYYVGSTIVRVFLSTRKLILMLRSRPHYSSG